MISEKVHVLSKVELFSELSLPELNELSEDFQWEEYPRGSDIIRQGQKHHWFHLLVEGSVQVLVKNKGAKPLLANSFIPGDVFGEISLFTGKPSPTTVHCIEGCKVLSLDSEHFARMLVRWPKLYETFLEKLSHQLNQVNVGFWEVKHKDFLRSGLQLNQFQSKFYGLWGSTKTTREVEKNLAKMSKTTEHLLLIGERGTGRQMMAWYLHKQQFGEQAPFIVVDGRHFDQQWGDLMFETHSHEDNLAAIKSSSLLDLSEGGTLFIRDVNRISPRAQLKLALALQAHEKECRVIGSLRADPELLSHRLVPQLKECFTQTYNITPLRERKKDIPVIAQGVLDNLAKQYNRGNMTLDPEATKLLLVHHYRQGNVTELIQVIERAFFLAENNVISLEHLFFGPTAEKIGRSINLLSWKWIDKIVKTGIFPLWIQRFSNVIFILVTFLLFFVPDKTVTAATFLLIWSLWWPALTILSPFFGRIWCGICPFAGIMQGIQKYIHFNRPVPDILKKYDYLFITFLFLMVFWTEAVTNMRYNPLYTGLWLVFIAALAIITAIVFTRHTWCRHLCPLGGFVGMASIGGMLEVRSDANICLNKCTTYECYRGKDKITGCPLSQYAPFVDNNLDCKLCLQCVRNCPNDAVQINLRIPAREVWHLVRVNQGFAIFIGVALGILFPIHYFEPLHGIWPTEKWRWWFSASYWGTAVAAGSLTWLIARPFKTKGASIRIKLVFSLIPLILSGYIVYQLRFLPGANSLMLGFGFQSPEGVTSPVYMPALIIEQVAAVLVGLALSSFTAIMVLVRNKQVPRDVTLSINPAAHETSNLH